MRAGMATSLPTTGSGRSFAAVHPGLRSSAWPSSHAHRDDARAPGLKRVSRLRGQTHAEALALAPAGASEAVADSPVPGCICVCCSERLPAVRNAPAPARRGAHARLQLDELAASRRRPATQSTAEAHALTVYRTPAADMKRATRGDEQGHLLLGGQDQLRSLVPESNGAG